MRRMYKLFSIVVLVCLITNSLAQTIVISNPKTAKQQLAAQELRRYIYALTGELLVLKNNNAQPAARQIILKIDGSLGPEEYAIQSKTAESKKLLYISGGTDQAVLYGSYRYLEELGVRYYLHGDVIPDKKIKFDIGILNIKGKPLFDTRGILPFHDFPEGPDWWNANNYKTVFSQLSKMGMNFAGFHNYPQSSVATEPPEPMVWIGRKEDVNEDGTVRRAYPARHFTTLSTSWGFRPKNTSNYTLGAGDFFAEDAYGSPYMKGRSPKPTNEAVSITLFNEAGKFYKDVFGYARRNNIRISVGTEIDPRLPFTIQEELKAKGKSAKDSTVVRELFEGSFKWIAKNYPADYYSLWLPERWTVNGNSPGNTKDALMQFNAAYSALKNLNSTMQLASCGWVLGPKEDRSMFDNYFPKTMPFSSINRAIGYTPVEPGFANMSGRPKWAMPWLEDDACTTTPQFWAGRMRRDAADALAYGCTGLVGIHWRTINVGPTISAMAKAAWQQEWNPDVDKKMSFEEANNHAANHPGERPVADFYQDWATAQFGTNVASQLGKIFDNLDGTYTGSKVTPKNWMEATAVVKMPRPSGWIGGPGGVTYDTVKWETRAKDYLFIRELETIRPMVKTKGNLERFDYWLNTFYYTRATGQLSCTMGEFRSEFEKIRALKTPAEQRAAAEAVLFPLRLKAVGLYEEVHKYLFKTINTQGELGNLTTWQQRSNYICFDQYTVELEKLLGRVLPIEAFPGNLPVYENRIILPDLRLNLEQGENLDIKAVILSTSGLKKAELKYRPLGASTYQVIPLQHISRKTYRVFLPKQKIKEDFEYRIEATTASGVQIGYPSADKNISQTVVIRSSPSW
jgi:hypothetical protein